MSRLCDATHRVPRPPIRVVHFGPGAFHRAHQAWYFDRMGFGISAVSLHSPGVRDALAPQDGLYTLIEREADPAVQIIGALREVLVAPEAPDAVFARLADPQVGYVTATVTEKGYRLTAAGELDLGHPDIVHDVARPSAPASFAGWVVEGLRRRRAAGHAPFVTISCDNLSDNGGRLGQAVVQLARAQGDEDLAGWIGAQAAFPSTMVDSITPATDDDLRARAQAATGLEDAWPIQRERFVQWVIEDRLGAEAGRFRAAGVTLTDDVAAFERAKLRLLNGAHSTLAYAGLLLGHETVAQAMNDPELAAFVEAMMRREIAPTLPATPGLDLSTYIDAVLARFRNPAIAHKLSQIAWDGSQKLPFRIMETAANALAAGGPLDRLAFATAAWMRFVQARARAGEEITDPLAPQLLAIGKNAEGPEPFLALSQVFPPAVADHPRFRQAVAVAHRRLGDAPRAALAA